jgi:hypothetical protein
MNERDLSVLNLVSMSDRDALREALSGWGYRVVELRGEDVVDKASLFLRATSDLPSLEEVAPTNWSGFGDGLMSMVFELEHPKVALLWTSAHRMLESGLADLLVATDVLVGNSRLAYAQDITFLTFLLGDGPNFPRMQGAG